MINAYMEMYILNTKKFKKIKSDTFLWTTVQLVSIASRADIVAQGGAQNWASYSNLLFLFTRSLVVSQKFDRNNTREDRRNASTTALQSADTRCPVDVMQLYDSFMFSMQLHKKAFNHHKRDRTPPAISVRFASYRLKCPFPIIVNHFAATAA